jgi:hypothetical protein
MGAISSVCGGSRVRGLKAVRREEMRMSKLAWHRQGILWLGLLCWREHRQCSCVTMCEPKESIGMHPGFNVHALPAKQLTLV